MTDSVGRIQHRVVPDNFMPGLICEHPILERIFVTRGICEAADLVCELKGLLPFTGLKDMDKAVQRIAKAIQNDERILILGDFDADGATSTVIAIKALKSMGAKQVDYLVPNRFEFGYGLSPEIVDVAKERKPD